MFYLFKIMLEMASVKVILKKEKKLMNGECPLYLRIIKDRKTVKISRRIKTEKNRRINLSKWP